MKNICQWMGGRESCVQVNIDRTSPKKVECPDFSDSKEETEVAGKKHHKNVVLDARSKDSDHQNG